MRSVLLILTLLVIFSSGCVRTEIKSKRRSGNSNLTHSSEKIDVSTLSLAFSGSKDKTNALGQIIPCTLTNKGQKTVTLNDWRIHDLDNITLECQVWYPGTDAPDPDAWVPIHEPAKISAPYPLTLKPGNMLTIDIPVDFLSSLVISENAERRYFIRAKLTLDSITVSTPVEAFTVRRK